MTEEAEQAGQGDQGGHVARILRDSSWSMAEIEAWAACKPLADRARPEVLEVERPVTQLIQRATRGGPLTPQD